MNQFHRHAELSHGLNSNKTKQKKRKLVEKEINKNQKCLIDGFKKKTLFLSRKHVCVEPNRVCVQIHFIKIALNSFSLAGAQGTALTQLSTSM